MDAGLRNVRYSPSHYNHPLIDKFSSINTVFRLKDFLLQYNKISESCFLHCVSHLSDRDLSQDECGCVDMCTKKHVSVNHKVMQVYMEVQPKIINKRMEEVTKQQAALEEARKKEMEAAGKNAVTDSEPAKVTNVISTGKFLDNKSNSGASENEVVLRTAQQ